MNGGYLILGVVDKTLDIVGIQEFGSYTLENIKHKLCEQCTNLPSEGLEINEYKTCDTKKIVWIIKVPKHTLRTPVYAHKHAWQRIGDSLVELTASRKAAILSEVSLPEDWTKAIIPEATIEDLDTEAIKKAREEFKERNPKYANEMQQWDDIKFLNKAQITIKGKITRAALILLGKKESEHFLSPGVIKIRWSLKTAKNENKDYEIFSMPMILAVDLLNAKIRNIKYVSIRPDTLFPDEMMRYDMFSIREPLNNCIAHQDYTKGARIEVVEYEDNRLIFQNAGNFIPTSIEAVLDSDCPESV
jgi:ATP-dependent DNA helicase RecG